MTRCQGMALGLDPTHGGISGFPGPGHGSTIGLGPVHGAAFTVIVASADLLVSALLVALTWKVPALLGAV